MKRFSIQHVRRTPPGWKVRTKRVGAHELRIAFPPGRRRKGSGEVVEILHPKKENPRSCLTRARKNPLELLVFGNPAHHQENPHGRARGHHFWVLEGKRLLKTFPTRAEAEQWAAASGHERAVVYDTQRENPEKWMAEAFGQHPGKLHRRLGYPVDEKIPAQVLHSELAKAKREGDTELEREIILALTGRKYGPKGGRHAAARSAAAKHRSAEKGARTRRDRANPSAANLYEQFHQEDPAETLEFNEPQDMPRHTAVLGDLIAIGFNAEGYDSDELVRHWKQCPHVEFEGDDVKVSANPSGTQLYFVGGNQDLRAQLKDFGKAGATGRVKLGPAAFIVYATRKGMDGFQMSDYIHKFGEDSGVVGNYWFDADDRRILIRGGDYKVTPDGIVN